MASGSLFIGSSKSMIDLNSVLSLLFLFDQFPEEDSVLHTQDPNIPQFSAEALLRHPYIEIGVAVTKGPLSFGALEEDRQSLSDAGLQKGLSCFL